MKIPVILSADNNIFFTLGSTIVSLLENASSDTFYEINILCAGDVTEENKQKILSLNKKNNTSIKLFDMKDKFKNIPVSKGYHVNYVSAYKMLIPQMFPQYDKVLYLDTDIIVRGDLENFYTIDLGNNYIASTPVFSNIIQQKEHFQTLLQIPDVSGYINAGVMLMNLKQIRADKIDEKWIELLGSFDGSVDQHILNKVCYNRTQIVPLKYNVPISEIELYENPIVNNYYTKQEITTAIENPIIFHFAGNLKPWKYTNIIYRNEWDLYFKKCPFYKNLERKLYIIPQTQIIHHKKRFCVFKFYLFGIPLFKIRNDLGKLKCYILGGFLKLFEIKKY